MTNTISKIAKTFVMGLALSTSIGAYADGAINKVGLDNALRIAATPINTGIERAKALYQQYGVSGIPSTEIEAGETGIKILDDSIPHPYLESVNVGSKYGVKIKFKAFTAEGIAGTNKKDEHDNTPVAQFLSEARIIVFPGKDVPINASYTGAVPAELTIFECATDADSKFTAFYGDVGNKNGRSIIAEEATKIETLAYLTGCYSVSAEDMNLLFAAY